MTRDEAIAVLLEPFRPLGPFEEPEEPDARQEAWARAAGPDALEAMLDLAAHPPVPGQTGSLSPTAFAFEVARVLALLGARDAPEFLAQTEPLLGDPRARPTLIDALSLMATGESLALLVPLVDAEDLTEQDAIRLADTFGEMAATHLLDKLQARIPPHWTQALREIEIARPD
jgi:hypothetical protein